ncbi:MAG: hypothetical protein IKZ34_00975 [Alphaproteobacteria bacterium]|nr:hypothetical protein [Alphaproteobacteria bacterium]
MKTLVIVLSSLLVLPAFAEVAPVFYEEEVIEYNDEMVADTDEVEVETKKVVTPAVQPSRVNPRGTSVASRAAARATPASASATNSRAVNSRGTVTSRKASQARAGATVTPRATTNSARVATRPSRTASATPASQGVTSRRAVQPKKTVTARAGSSTGALYNSSTRIGTRTSSAIQARSPNVLSGLTSTTLETTTEEKQEAISAMDEITQMTDYCKAQYTSCMDNFCNVLDDNYGRCSCSRNIKNYEATENALKKATDALQDVTQQIQYIGLSADDIETLFKQTEAELAMQDISDNTKLKNSLDSIKNSIVDIKTTTAASTETSLGFDLSSMMLDNSFTQLINNNSSNTNSISNQRGEQLYKTAAARCKTSVLNKCQSQGVDISVITNAYDLEIDKECLIYERSLTTSNENMTNTVRNAKVILQKARLMVAQQKNSYDLRGCVNALDSCMQDDFVCGTDYENCLDPSGKYIVNGSIVIGSTPGYPIDEKTSDVSPAPIQHHEGLYSTWNYGSDKNAWVDSGTLADYIDSNIGTIPQTKTSSNMVEFLKYKIGYVQDKKNYGMCVSILNKCQKYTYDDKDNFLYDNQVIREYLQRILAQIKVSQDNIVSNYAANCISDVNSCLSSNSYATNQNYAINACKAQIVTCMSVNGNALKEPTPNLMKVWVDSIQSNQQTTNTTAATEWPIKFQLNGLATAATDRGNGTYNIESDYLLPVNSTITRAGTVPAATPLYWCWYKYPYDLHCVLTNTTAANVKIPAGMPLLNGIVYLSTSKTQISNTLPE